MTNSTDALPNTSKKIISSSEMPFFTPPVVGAPKEAGMRRVVNFINNNGSLIRNNSHLLIILVSNGRDNDLETDDDGRNDTPTIITSTNQSNFSQRVMDLNSIKSSKMLLELRFMPITAHSYCGEARASTNSYVRMGGALTTAKFSISVQTLFQESSLK